MNRYELIEAILDKPPEERTLADWQSLTASLLEISSDFKDEALWLLRENLQLKMQIKPKRSAGRPSKRQPRGLLSDWQEPQRAVPKAIGRPRKFTIRPELMTAAVQSLQKKNGRTSTRKAIKTLLIGIGDQADKDAIDHYARRVSEQLRVNKALSANDEFSALKSFKAPSAIPAEPSWTGRSIKGSRY